MQFQLMQNNYNEHFASVFQSTNATFVVVVAEAGHMYIISYIYLIYIYKICNLNPLRTC